MKFALFVATLAIVQGVTLEQKGINDESYDSHFDQVAN